MTLDQAPPGQRIVEIYDRFAPEYDTLYGSPLDRAEDQYVAGLLDGLIGVWDRVIDLGCGTGILLDLCPISPAHYLGIDLAPKMLEVARRKWPQHTFRQADMIATGAHDAFSVAIGLFGSPAYPDHQALLGELQRILHPGGRFFLMFFGAGVLERPGVTAKATRGLWQTCQPEALLATFRAACDGVAVIPLSGHMTAQIAVGAQTLQATLDAEQWLDLLQKEQSAMMGDAHRETAYWEILTGRMRR